MKNNISKFGKSLTYTGEACPKCSRYRLLRYENGKTHCEKCHWCPEDQRYYSPYDEVFFDEDLNEHWNEWSDRILKGEK